MNESPTKQKRTNRFLRATEVALASYLAVCVIVLSFEPETVPVFARLATIVIFAAFAVSLVVMFVYRNADEYTQSIWNTGASTSFIATTLLVVFGSFFEQLFYWYVGSERLVVQGEDYATWLIMPVLLLSFLIGATAKRLLTS